MITIFSIISPSPSRILNDARSGKLQLIQFRSKQVLLFGHFSAHLFDALVKKRSCIQSIWFLNMEKNLTSSCHALKCEFVGHTCTVYGKVKDAVTLRTTNAYEYGCYIKYDHGEVMFVMQATSSIFMLFSLHIFYEKFFSKKRLIDKLTILTTCLRHYLYLIQEW